MLEILHTYIIDPIIEDPLMCGLIPFVIGAVAGILNVEYQKYKEKIKEDKNNG